jgi:Xaa-Pro aminopeptidase
VIFSPSIYRDRTVRIQRILRERQIDYLLIGPGPNLFYFTGIEAHISERLELLVVPAEGTPRLIVPALEKPAVEPNATFFDLLPWTDEETSAPALAAAFEGVSQKLRVAVDNQLWSLHLLTIQQEVKHAEWIRASDAIKLVRGRKSAEEIALLKQAASIADAALAELCKTKLSGRTEREIMNEIQRLLLSHGDEVMSFCIVGSGSNSAVPHHNSSDRMIQSGEPLLLDFGGAYHGYQSDMTRMLWVGETPSEEFMTVYNIVNEARSAGHRSAKPRATCESVDAATRAVIEEAGYGEYFIHRTGHGLGIDVHEDPYIIAGNTEVLEEGMVFSIEPGIYLSGKFGVRIEDIAIITNDGEENINRSSHQLILVN